MMSVQITATAFQTTATAFQATATASQKKAPALAVAFLLLGLTAIACLFTSSAQAETSQAIPKSQNTAQSEQAEEKQHKIYVALGDDNNSPLKQAEEIFDCTDKVYAVVELENYPLGKHQLSVRWLDPARTAREHTQYEFNVRNKNTRLWAWLSLSRGAGAGMLQWINPAAGLEDFIGIWEIEVKIDGKRLDKKSFEVSC